MLGTNDEGIARARPKHPGLNRTFVVVDAMDAAISGTCTAFSDEQDHNGITRSTIFNFGTVHTSATLIEWMPLESNKNTERDH